MDTPQTVSYTASHTVSVVNMMSPAPSETSYLWRKMFHVSTGRTCHDPSSELWTTSSLSLMFPFWWSLKLNVGWASFWGVSVSCEETFNIHMFIISDIESSFLSGWSKTRWRTDPPVQRHSVLLFSLASVCCLYHEQHAAANAYLIRWGGGQLWLCLCGFVTDNCKWSSAAPKVKSSYLQDQPIPCTTTGKTDPPTSTLWWALTAAFMSHGLILNWSQRPLSSSLEGWGEVLSEQHRGPSGAHVEVMTPQQAPCLVWMEWVMAWRVGCWLNMYFTLRAHVGERLWISPQNTGSVV